MTHLHYKTLIDADIAVYIEYLNQSQSHMAVKLFAAQLGQPAVRLPGLLTMIGYEMCGGTNQKMIIQAARVMEMCLIYVQLFKSEPLAAALGNHAAQTILANLDVEPLLRSNTVSITNRTLLLALQNPDDLATKAHYTSVNPIHVGMVLAGAGCRHTDAITPIAQSLGSAIYLPKTQTKPHIEQLLSALSKPSTLWTSSGTQLLIRLASQVANQ